MTWIGFPTLSLIFMIIFLLLYFSKERVNLFENKVVIIMMILNTIGLVLELGCYAVMVWWKNETTFFGMLILKSYVAYIPLFNLLLTGYIFLITSKYYGKQEAEVKKYFYKVVMWFLPMTLFIIIATYITELKCFNEYPKYYTYGLSTDFIFPLTQAFLSIDVVVVYARLLSVDTPVPLNTALPSFIVTVSIVISPDLI